MFSKIIFRLLYFAVYLLSLLPFWIIYLLSYGFFFIIYYLIGYRKKVVFQNLKNAFPEKNEAEIKLLAKKFFRYLCDFIFEIIKINSMTEKDFFNRCTISLEAEKLFGDRKSVV